jgi:hypothetical protein
MTSHTRMACSSTYAVPCLFERGQFARANVLALFTPEKDSAVVETCLNLLALVSDRLRMV